MVTEPPHCGAGLVSSLVDGRLKIDVAKDVMARIIEDLPDDVPVALRVYGHRIREGDKGDCQDSELVFPMQKMDKRRLLHQVRNMKALGTTPLAYSLQLAGEDLRHISGPKHIILVTDGKEECGGNPPEVAERLVRSGLHVRVDVVGFALADAATRRDMQRVAKITGGLYADAKSTRELLQAIQQALAAPYAVLDAAGQRVGGDRVGQPAIPVPAGIYTVVVHTADRPMTISNVRITPNSLTRVELKKEGQQMRFRGTSTKRVKFQMRTVPG